MIAAGDEPYRLSETLFYLAHDVGIGLPQFYGSRVYQDPNGAEKWVITTCIPGRVGEEDEDPGMHYTQDYPDWFTSVELAILGAMSRIIYKYNDYMSDWTVFRYMGARDETGEAIVETGENISSLRSHFMEREALAVATESLLAQQLSVIDEQRARIKQMEIAMLNMDDIIEGSKAKEKQKDAITFAIQAQSAYFAKESYGMDKVKEENKALKEELEELQKKMSKMTMDLEKSSSSRGPHPKKRMKAPTYFKLFTPPPPPPSDA